MIRSVDGMPIPSRQFNRALSRPNTSPLAATFSACESRANSTGRFHARVFRVVHPRALAPIHAGAFAPEYATTAAATAASIPPRQFNRALSLPTTVVYPECGSNPYGAPIQPGAFAPDYRPIVVMPNAGTAMRQFNRALSRPNPRPHSGHIQRAGDAPIHAGAFAPDYPLGVIVGVLYLA